MEDHGGCAPKFRGFQQEHTTCLCFFFFFDDQFRPILSVTLGFWLRRLQNLPVASEFSPASDRQARTMGLRPQAYILTAHIWQNADVRKNGASF